LIYANANDGENYRPLIRKQAAKLSRYRTDYAKTLRLRVQVSPGQGSWLISSVARDLGMTPIEYGRAPHYRKPAAQVA
jgi:hypothetical protein